MPSRRERGRRVAGGADRAGGRGAGRRHAGHLRRGRARGRRAGRGARGRGRRRRSRPSRRPLEPVDWTTRWRDGLGAAAVRSAHRGAVLGRVAERRTVRRSCSIPRRPSAAASTARPAPRSRCSSATSAPATGCSTSGSGSGILAIAAVKLGAAGAVGIEIDAEANPVAVAERRAERRRRPVVEFLEGDAGDLAPLLGPADLLLSNILRTVNTALLPAIVGRAPAGRPRHLLRDGGARRRRSSGPRSAAAGLDRAGRGRPTPAGGRWPRRGRDHGAGAAGRHRRGVAASAVRRGASNITCACGGPRRRARGAARRRRARRHRPARGRRARRWEVEVESAERRARPAELTLAVGAGDRERFGWLVEKAVELGVTRIVPLRDRRGPRRREPGARAARGRSSGARRSKRSSSAARRGRRGRGRRSRASSELRRAERAPVSAGWPTPPASAPPGVAGRGAGHGRHRSRGRSHRRPERATLAAARASARWPWPPHTLRFETAALAAAAAVASGADSGGRMADCLFCKIVAGEIPAKIVKRTDDAVAFHDIDPKAPVHVLVIPTRHVPAVRDANGPDGEALLGRLLAFAAEVATRARAGCRGLPHRDQHRPGCRPERGPSALARAGRAEDDAGRRGERAEAGQLGQGAEGYVQKPPELFSSTLGRTLGDV